MAQQPEGVDPTRTVKGSRVLLRSCMAWPSRWRHSGLPSSRAFLSSRPPLDRCCRRSLSRFRFFRQTFTLTPNNHRRRAFLLQATGIDFCAVFSRPTSTFRRDDFSRRAAFSAAADLPGWFRPQKRVVFGALFQNELPSRIMLSHKPPNISCTRKT